MSPEPVGELSRLWAERRPSLQISGKALFYRASLLEFPLLILGKLVIPVLWPQAYRPNMDAEMHPPRHYYHE
jgi:hypothetical protein